MLFSKDRDPNVIIEVAPPPPPPPERPAPPLPKYYGQMGFAEPVILLSTDRSPQRSYRVGDKVDDFKVAAFDAETLTLEWDEKMLKNDLKDLRAKEPERPVQRAAAPSTAAAPQAKGITKMGNAAAKSDPVLGPPNGMYRSCVAGDNSPSGIEKDGYKKVIVTTLMGSSCQWEPIR
jgi:hypothetical protein